MITVDKKILKKSAEDLYRDVGSLRDFRTGLRNTIASLYYEHWWFQTTKDVSTGHPGWIDHAVTRMGLYNMVPSMVELMRKTRAENRAVGDMMVGTTWDLLRYNLQDVTGKSAADRAMEKPFRKPFHEVPGIYRLMERVVPGLRVRASSSADVSGSRGTGPGEKSPAAPSLRFISELPDPSESRPERVIQFRGYSVSYYRNPKSYGEIVAGIAPLYEYPQVAVVEKQNEQVLIVRTEKGVGGTTFLCRVSRDGSRGNLGEFAPADSGSFLERVLGEVTRLQSGKM